MCVCLCVCVCWGEKKVAIVAVHLMHVEASEFMLFNICEYEKNKSAVSVAGEERDQKLLQRCTSGSQVKTLQLLPCKYYYNYASISHKVRGLPTPICNRTVTQIENRIPQSCNIT